MNVSVENILDALNAAKTEGRICQRNWQMETEREVPSEKRLEFLQHQAARIHRIVDTLQSLVPNDYRTSTNPMSYNFE